MLKAKRLLVICVVTMFAISVTITGFADYGDLAVEATITSNDLITVYSNDFDGDYWDDTLIANVNSKFPEHVTESGNGYVRGDGAAASKPRPVIDLGNVYQTYGAGTYTVSFKIRRPNASPTGAPSFSIQNMAGWTNDALKIIKTVNPSIAQADGWKDYSFTFDVTSAKFDSVLYLYSGGSDSGVGVIDMDDILVTTPNMSAAVPTKVSDFAGKNISVIGNIYVTNYTNAINGVFISAIYGENNALIEAKATNYTTIAGASSAVTDPLSFDVPADADENYKIKCFAWDSFAQISPINIAYTFYESLLPNSGIECIGSTNMGRLGWKVRSDSPKAVTTQSHTGKYALNMPAGAVGAIEYDVTGLVKKYGAGTYKLSFWAKCSGLQLFNIPLRIVGGTGAGDKNFAPTVASNGVWTKSSESSYVVSDVENITAATLIISRTVYTENVYLDDFVLTKVD